MHMVELHTTSFQCSTHVFHNPRRQPQIATMRCPEELCPCAHVRQQHQRLFIRDHDSESSKARSRISSADRPLGSCLQGGILRRGRRPRGRSSGWCGSGDSCCFHCHLRRDRRPGRCGGGLGGGRRGRHGGEGRFRGGSRLSDSRGSSRSGPSRRAAFWWCGSLRCAVIRGWSSHGRRGSRGVVSRRRCAGCGSRYRAGRIRRRFLW